MLKIRRPLTLWPFRIRPTCARHMERTMHPASASLRVQECVDGASFHPRWRSAFADLNRAWIERYFRMEPQDEAVLCDPEGQILSPGGEIFFACWGDHVVGTCALMPLEPGTWEIAKLAVDPACQGRGIGRTLITRGMEAALQKGATRLLARTSPLLGASLHLFVSLGFLDRGPDPSGDYARASLLLEYPLSAGRSAGP